MGWIGDLAALFDRSKTARRTLQAPDRIDAIEKRLEILEAKLGNKWPADVCSSCGERALRMDDARVVTGGTRQFWKCGSCSKVEPRLIRP